MARRKKPEISWDDIAADLSEVQRKDIAPIPYGYWTTRQFGEMMGCSLSVARMKIRRLRKQGKIKKIMVQVARVDGQAMSVPAYGYLKDLPDDDT